MRKIIIIIIFGILFSAGYSFAQPEEIIFHDLGVRVGLEASHITYKEPGVMKEKGFMYGIAGSLTYRAMDKYMLRLEARGSLGQVDYSSSSSGTVDDIDDYMLEFRGLAGYDFYVSETFAITPYIGAGYRHLDDEMGGKVSTTGVRGYDREITYLYSPIGIDVSTVFENGWNIKLRLEYDYFWDGNVESHMATIPGYYDIENDQDKGYGYRGSIMFRKRAQTIDFIIEPFFRYWSIGDSKVTTDPGGTSWIEPKNNSKEFGINLAIAY